jgi:Zn finger protein HypA/HybF involved in hydrogenase expression
MKPIRDLRVKVVCLECGKRSTVSTMAAECPKCGSVDLELA